LKDSGLPVNNSESFSLVGLLLGTEGSSEEGIGRLYLKITVLDDFSSRSSNLYLTGRRKLSFSCCDAVSSSFSSLKLEFCICVVPGLVLCIYK
jgi:hypothetical protein